MCWYCLYTGVKLCLYVNVELYNVNWAKQNCYAEVHVSVLQQGRHTGKPYLLTDKQIYFFMLTYNKLLIRSCIFYQYKHTHFIYCTTCTMKVHWHILQIYRDSLYQATVSSGRRSPPGDGLHRATVSSGRRSPPGDSLLRMTVSSGRRSPTGDSLLRATVSTGRRSPPDDSLLRATVSNGRRSPPDDSLLRAMVSIRGRLASPLQGFHKLLLRKGQHLSCFNVHLKFIQIW